MTTEQVQDIVGAMFSGNTETNITATYQDSDGTIDLAADNDNTQLTTEEVQDIVGAMFSGNTETRISATYQDGDGTIDLVVDDMTANTDTTYDLVTSASGDNVQLLLDASSGDDDPILITAGTNVSFSGVSATGFTINTSATLSGTIAQANTVKISTATGNEYKNITFVDRDVTNASYDSLKIDSEDDQLSYNPNANRIKTTGIQLSRIYTTSASAGTSGQVLTSGGSSGDFSWTNADCVGRDNYAISLSFGAGTLTLGRTGSLSNLTASIPLSGITGGFTDLDDTPGNYTGDANKVVVVNSSGNGLTFATSSSVGSDTNYYLSGLSFNTGNGVLTATVTGASNQTVDLDGRYVLQSTGGNSGVPTGVIVIWSGAQADIPTGWVICDGNNSTPDLRSRFVIGAGSGGLYSVGDTGGSKDATLVSHSHTINNHTHTINNHTHDFSASTTGGNHDHQYIDQYVVINNGYRPWPASNNDCAQRNINTTGSGSHSHSISGTTGNPSNRGTGNPSDRGTDSQGSSATNANLPPYYALCYIMKT